MKKKINRFNVYDWVWIMENNKPKKLKVFAVVMSMNSLRRDIEVYYHLVESSYGVSWGNNEGIKVAQESVHASKEDLITSLFED